MDSTKDKIERNKQLVRFCRELFDTSNLIYSDFDDVSIKNIKRPFIQCNEGVLVQFSVSYNLIGKANNKVSESLHILLREDDN